MPLTVLTAEEIQSRFSPAKAVHALRSTLQSGLQLGNDPQRSSIPVEHGNFLLMPATAPELGFGIKLLSLSDPGYRPELPSIQGTYVLFDPKTLSPSHLLEGEAITNLRTPAVSVATVLNLLEGPGSNATSADAPLKVVIFGTGPQGRHHAATLIDTLRERPVEFSFVSRNRPTQLAHAATWLAAGSPEAAAALAAAELVITATNSPEPLFGLGDVRGDAIVIALGSHTPQAREISGELMRSATIIVEDVETTFAEGGDVVQAEAEGFIDRGAVLTMAQVIRGEAEISRERPVVFKFTGMAWEDLVVARAIADEFAAAG